MNIHETEITDCTISDISMLDDIISANIKINNLFADRAYYSINKVEELNNKGIIPIIPPSKNSRIHYKDNTTWHDKVTKYIKEKRSVYAFFKKNGYGKRELIETEILRVKRFMDLHY